VKQACWYAPLPVIWVSTCMMEQQLTLPCVLSLQEEFFRLESRLQTACIFLLTAMGVQGQVHLYANKAECALPYYLCHLPTPMYWHKVLQSYLSSNAINCKIGLGISAFVVHATLCLLQLGSCNHARAIRHTDVLEHASS
jgi:hypothetical protein